MDDELGVDNTVVVVVVGVERVVDTILDKEATHKARLQIRKEIPRHIRHRDIPVYPLVDGRYLDMVPIRMVTRQTPHKEIPSDIHRR